MPIEANPRNKNSRASYSARGEAGARFNTEIIDDRYLHEEDIKVRELLTDRGKENISAIVKPSSK